MFQRKVSVEYLTEEAPAKPCPIHWLDNFAMRNFTNDAIFDDTLPTADGLLEIGNRVPLDRLQTSMQDWFRRKGYLQKQEELRITEQQAKPSVFF
jgi:hypothetical protein